MTPLSLICGLSQVGGIDYQSNAKQDNGGLRHDIMRCMSIASPREKIETQVIRDGQQPSANQPDKSSPEERIEEVWTLTKLCLAWRDSLANEPRLQRSITRVQRSRR